MTPTKKATARDESRWGWAVCGGRSALWLSLFVTLTAAGLALAQSFPNSGGQVSNRPVRPTMPDVNQTISGPSSDPVFQERRLRQLNAAQHKAMVSDADKLLALVTELNSQIDSSNPATLTPDQLRMVAEIEKLAHSVKDKMKNSMLAPPTFMDAQPGIPSGPPRR